MADRFRLQVFATLAACGSFSAAARVLGISQPAVSQNIAELEKYAGARLFSRSRASVALTAKGREFLRRSQAVLAAYERLDRGCKAPETILIKGVTLRGERRDILIDRGFIADTDVQGNAAADRVIQASGLEMFPGYYDTFCSCADCLPHSPADGCSFVSFASQGLDDDFARVEDLGIRAAVAVSPDDRELLKSWENPSPEKFSLILDIPSVKSYAPDRLCGIFAFARKRGFRIRLSAQGRGGVVKYLDSLHLLGSDLFLYSCSCLDEDEWRLPLLRRVNIIHCPTSDYRESGVRFPYERAIASGCRILLGTGDSRHGIAEELRTARLLSSVGGKALDFPALFGWASVNGSEAFGTDAGSFSRGSRADAVLAVPGPDGIPEASAIRCLICGGRIVFSCIDAGEDD